MDLTLECVLTAILNVLQLLPLYAFIRRYIITRHTVALLGVAAVGISLLCYVAHFFIRRFPFEQCDVPVNDILFTASWSSFVTFSGLHLTVSWY